MVSSASCFVLENESCTGILKGIIFCATAMLDTDKLRKIQFAEMILTCMMHVVQESLNTTAAEMD